MAKEYKVPFEVYMRRNLVTNCYILTNLDDKLDNSELLKFDSFVNNEWVQARSGARFEVIGKIDLPLYYFPPLYFNSFL